MQEGTHSVHFRRGGDAQHRNSRGFSLFILGIKVRAARGDVKDLEKAAAASGKEDRMKASLDNEAI